MTDEFLKDTVEIEHNNGKYEFRIPTIEDELQIGFIERNLRRDFEMKAMTPDELQFRRPIGDPDGLDMGTVFRIRAIAHFQRLLVKSDVNDNWCWSGDAATSKPIVDYRKWSIKKLNLAVDVFLKLNGELTRFREDGDNQDQAIS